MVRLRLGHLRTYLVSHPEYIDYILRRHAENFHKDKMTRWLMPLVGEGLLTSEDAYWRRQRSWPSRPFSTSRSSAMARSWSSRRERMLDTWNEGEVRDPHEDLMRLTLGIVARTLFDAELSGDAEVDRRVARGRHEPLHESDAVVPDGRLLAFPLEPEVPGRHPPHRRDHLPDHPRAAANRARTRATWSRDCWPRATTKDGE